MHSDQSFSNLHGNINFFPAPVAYEVEGGCNYLQPLCFAVMSSQHSVKGHRHLSASRWNGDDHGLQPESVE